MRVKNLTPFVFGFKACSRKPPQPAMMEVVRGKFDLRLYGHTRLNLIMY